MSWGLLNTGYRRPTFQELWEALRARLRAATWSDEDGNPMPGSELDLEGGSPITIFSEAALGELNLLHQETEAVYNANKVGGAFGRSLEDLVEFQRLVRDPAQRATNVVTFSGTNGATIPVATEVSASSTEKVYRTTEERTILAGGSVDVLVEAMDYGPSFNCRAGIIDTLDDSVSGISGVTNRDHAATLSLANVGNAVQSVAKDDGVTDFQTVRLADIEHPHKVSKISLKLKNGTAGQLTYNLHLEVFDHGTAARLCRSHSKEVTLAAGASQWVTWEGLALDAHEGGSVLRVALVNHATSGGVIQWETNSTDPYSGGAFYLNGSAVAGHDALLRITSETVGAFTSGCNEESDADLVNRFLISKGRGASAIPRKIVANVWAVSGVRSVGYRHNREDEEVEGLRRRSVELTVYGGETQDIAECLMNVVAAGIRTEGTVEVLVEDDYGQEHTMRFNRPTEKPVYVIATVTKDTDFPVDGDDQVKDAIVQYIGGEDAGGALVTGIAPADDVIASKIVSAIMGVAGVLDASITLGFSADPEGTSNLTIAVSEMAVTDPSLITVEAA